MERRLSAFSATRARASTRDIHPGRSWLPWYLWVVAAVLAYIAVRDHFDSSWIPATLISAVFVLRGVMLHRPIVRSHAVWWFATAVAGALAFMVSHPAPGAVLLIAAGPLLVLPLGSTICPADRAKIADLVDRTHDDVLAPFALHTMKSYFFSDTGAAAVAYHSRAGIAVVSGDPVGDESEFDELAISFADFARSRGWRVAVLAGGERHKHIWSRPELGRHALRAIPFGRDVVLDPREFGMAGRQFRNLRQAVSRSHNAGVTTSIAREDLLDDAMRTELLAVVEQAHHGGQNRGYAMILDHLLDGTHPGTLVVMARDASGDLVGFARYATSGRGRELTLDVPWRRPGAPNGVDERMTVDMITWAADHGAERLSLAFAAFPEIFDTQNTSTSAALIRRVLALASSLIAVGSLSAYLRKFHAHGNRRYVLLRIRDLVPVLFAVLTLEFVPHRRQR